MFRWLPDFIKQLVTVTTSNRAVFEFSNGSKIIAESSTGTAAIGFTSNLVILDEAAHIDRLDELWGSVGPTLSAGGSCIAISTPNGIGNWYHENFMAAERGENLFNPITLPWDSRPDRDQEWFEKEKKSMSKRKFAQEYLCNFLSSGNTYFEQEELDKIRAGVRDPIRKEGFDRNIWIWEDPIPGESYLISSDTARGDATDYSVWHVLKLSSMEVVCEYQGKVPQEIFANMLYAWGMKYNGCMLVVENNMLGSAVLDKLVNLNYPNLYYTTKATLEYLDPLAAEQKPNAVLGFPTSGKSRPIIIEKLNEFVRNDMIKINSKRMLYEMTTFIWKDGKPQASNRSTDDLVLALSIGIFVRDTAIVMNQRNLEYNKVLLTSIKTSNSVFDSKISGMKGWIPMITPEQREEMKQNSWLYDSPMIVKG